MNLFEVRLRGVYFKENAVLVRRQSSVRFRRERAGGGPGVNVPAGSVRTHPESVENERIPRRRSSPERERNSSSNVSTGSRKRVSGSKNIPETESDFDASRRSEKVIGIASAKDAGGARTDSVERDMFRMVAPRETENLAVEKSEEAKTFSDFERRSRPFSAAAVVVVVVVFGKMSGKGRVRDDDSSRLGRRTSKGSCSLFHFGNDGESDFDPTWPSDPVRLFEF